MPGTSSSSYYDHNNRAAAALLRARQPYLIKNLLVGSGLFAFSIGIYMMTFKLVKQDDFSDVKVPEKPALQSIEGQTKR